MTTYPQYFTNNGVGCVSVDGLTRCGLGELGIDLVKNPDSNAESFTLRTTDMAVEYNFNSATSTTSLADIATIGNRLSSVVSPPDVNTLQVEDAVQIQGTSNSIILSASAGLNQLLLNDGAGENGMFLASGGADGGLYWTTGGGSGGSQNLASVLAVSPAGEGDPNQSIKLSRDVDETHPYGIDVLLNGGGGRLTTSYQLTATENENFVSASLYPDNVSFITENNTDPAVKNTLIGSLDATELSITSQTGDPAVIQYDTMTLTHNSLTFNAQLGEADPIGLSLDSAKIGLISGGNTDYGTEGQVLTSGGVDGTLTWADTITAVPSLAEVLAVAPAGEGDPDQPIFLSRSADETHPYGIQMILNNEGSNGSIQLSCQFAESASDNFQSNVLDYTGVLITNENNILDPVISTAQLQSTELKLNTETPLENHIIYKEASLTTSTFHLTAEQDEDGADGIYIDPLKIGLKLGGVLSYGTEGQVLTSGGESGTLTWADTLTSAPSLAEVLAVAPAGEGDTNQSIQLSRGADGAHPNGINVLLNGSNGQLSTSYSYTATGLSVLLSGSLTADSVVMETDNTSDPAVKNTLQSRLYANELVIESQTGDSATIQDDTMTLTHNSLTFNAQLGEADPIGLSLDSAKIGLISGGNTDYGTAGQVLTSGGVDGTLTWEDSATTPSLASVLAVAPAGVGNDDQSIYLSRSADEGRPNGIQMILNGGSGNIQLACQFAETQGENFQDIVADYTGVIITNENNTADPVISTAELKSTELKLNTQNPSGGNIIYKEASLTTSTFHLTATQNEEDPDGIYIDPLKIGLQTGGVLSYGEDGQVLTSGGSSGQLSWATPSGATPSLADVLAVAPAGEGTEGQIITLSKDAVDFVGDGTNIMSGAGMVMDFQGVEIASNLRFVNEVLPHFTHIKTFDSSVFPPIDNQPEYETFVESGFISITQSRNVDDVAVQDYISLQPTKIEIGANGGVGNAGTAGQVLTSGGDDGFLSWETIETPTLQSVLNSGNIAKNTGDNVSSIVLQETETGSFGSQTTITDTSIRCMTFGSGSSVITNCEMKGGDASNAGLGIEAGNIDIVGQKVSIIPTTISVEGRETGDVYKVSRLYNNVLQMIDGDGTTNYTAVYLDSTNQEVRIESKHTGVDDKFNQITSSAVNINDTFNSKSILLSNDDEKITLINGELEADRNLITLDNINSEVILEKIQTGIDDITTINLSEVSITDRLTSSSGKLEKNTLTLTNATAGTEIKLETTDGLNNYIYVKETGGMGLTQTTITPTQVKVLENSFQENYLAIEPTKIGISNAGVLDYGGSGDLLTSGGSLGGVSWGGNLADYLTTATASSTYQTIADMVNYLTTATASSTYQTIADMTNYLTTAVASSTYQAIATLGTALSTITPIEIGTNAGNANTITIGNNTLPTSNFPIVNIKGKFSINDVLFSGADGGSPQIGVATFTIPQDGLRNSLYTLIISGTAGPTPLNFPTNDTGGKYITIYNAGSQAIRCLCSAVPARNFFGGNNGLGGGSEYAIRGNQVVQFLSAGASGFLVFAQTNPNSNQGAFPYPLQNLTANQRIFSTRITGASVNGTFTYTPLAFGSAPSVQLTAEDATGNHTMTLRTNTTTGFTYVSSTGSFPTALHIYAVGQ